MRISSLNALISVHHIKGNKSDVFNQHHHYINGDYDEYNKKAKLIRERTPLEGDNVMSEYLVIVESPAKAKTIERYLGKNTK